MTRYLIIALVAFLAWKFWKSRQTPYGGFVATGWAGGNSQANLPSLVNTGNVVASQPNATGAPAPGNSFVEQNAGGWG